MSIIRRIPNYEHTALCVAAIRERWANDASFRTGTAVPSNVVTIGKRRAVSHG